MAMVFAPQRGETLTLFCQLAQQKGLIVSQHQQYDSQVTDVHVKVRNTEGTAPKGFNLEQQYVVFNLKMRISEYCFMIY